MNPILSDKRQLQINALKSGVTDSRGSPTRKKNDGEDSENHPVYQSEKNTLKKAKYILQGGGQRHKKKPAKRINGLDMYSDN